ncbi:hypothetical protein AMELA_G00079690 [Ameiurus melas]|uniref:Uncharacterized protein n=1 Tax=Ameiurus melas TaxID=219545 RepID=A0A7J6B1A5_AMEME|nr:hypothetical protein AMELA_G00079690 [Ameiurus melas]
MFQGRFILAHPFSSAFIVEAESGACEEKRVHVTPFLVVNLRSPWPRQSVLCCGIRLKAGEPEDFCVLVVME